MFLARYAETHLLHDAADHAGVTADAVRAAMEADPAFAAKVAEAEARHLERVDLEILDQAGLLGEDHEGKLTNSKLLMLYAQRRINAYRTQFKIEHSGTVVSRQTVRHVLALGELSETQLEHLQQLLGDEAVLPTEVKVLGTTLNGHSNGCPPST